MEGDLDELIAALVSEHQAELLASLGDADMSDMTARADTVAALLRASALPPLEARILLGHALGWRRTELITRADQPLDSAQAAAWRTLEARRMAGEAGSRSWSVRGEFYGLEFEVTPHVLDSPAGNRVAGRNRACRDRRSRPPARAGSRHR